MNCSVCSTYASKCLACQRCYSCLLFFPEHEKHQITCDLLLILDGGVSLESIKKTVNSRWPDRLRINAIKDVRDLFHYKRIYLTLAEAVKIVNTVWERRR